MVVLYRKILSGITSSFASVADVIATIAMCHFLGSHRPGHRKSTVKSIVNTLIFYSINRGMLIIFAQVAILLVFSIDSSQVWWLPPHFLLSKFHIITLLSLLNSRSSMASRSETGSANYISTLEFPATVTVNVSRSHAAALPTATKFNVQQQTRRLNDDRQHARDAAVSDVHGSLKASQSNDFMEFAYAKAMV